MSIIKSQVDRIFKEASDRFDKIRRNPVAGGSWLNGFDPIAPQKALACKALFAQQHVARHGPPSAPPLPLSHDEREDLRGQDLFGYLWALYARSWEGQNYDPQEHPSFDDYARGVLAAEERGEFGTLQFFPPAEILQIKKRLPPKPLSGLGPGFYWEPPKQHARTMASYRRSIARCK